MFGFNALTCLCVPLTLLVGVIYSTIVVAEGLFQAAMLISCIGKLTRSCSENAQSVVDTEL